ncbi:MAG: hypothetical protein Kow0067_17900 [Coriobacteriia bacterium]|jgi:Sec-independent protein secretion pathway components
MTPIAQGLSLMAVFGLPGGMEWIVILAVVLLLFGPTQLPKLAKMFGKSAKALREGMNEGLADEDEESVADKKDNKVAASEKESDE